LKNSDKISQLIDFIENDNGNTHFEISIGKVTKRTASVFYKYLKINIRRSFIVIDSSAIRHTMRRHGYNQQRESKSGQVIVSYKDFKLIPNIIAHAGNIEYKGKNNLKQDVFLFIKQLDNLYFIAMCVRPSKYGTKLVFGTMYIRKTKKPV